MRVTPVTYRAKVSALGVAFQNHALLPWPAVRGTLGPPFKLTGRHVDETRITPFIELVGLTDFARAQPKHLSDGAREPVSCARALTMSPTVLLREEPIDALDAVPCDGLNVELGQQPCDDPLGTACGFNTYGASRGRRLWHRALPSALPNLPIAMLGALSAEWLIGQNGVVTYRLAEGAGTIVEDRWL